MKVLGKEGGWREVMGDPRGEVVVGQEYIERNETYQEHLQVPVSRSEKTVMVRLGCWPVNIGRPCDCAQEMLPARFYLMAAEMLAERGIIACPNFQHNYG